MDLILNKALFQRGINDKVKNFIRKFISKNKNYIYSLSPNKIDTNKINAYLKQIEKIPYDYRKINNSSEEKNYINNLPELLGLN